MIQHVDIGLKWQFWCAGIGRQITFAATFLTSDAAMYLTMFLPHAAGGKGKPSDEKIAIITISFMPWFR